MHVFSVGTNVGAGNATTFTDVVTVGSTGVSVLGVYVGPGAANTSTQNTAVGESALASITNTTQSTAVGYQAAYGATDYGTTAIGYRALKNIGLGPYSVAVGADAGVNLAGATTSNGRYNVLIGTGAGAGVSGSSVYNYCVYVGAGAGTATTTGEYNTCVGINSGGAITTGSRNTILGTYTGVSGALDIRTSTGSIALSNGDNGILGAWWTDGGGWYQRNNSASWSTTSDIRIKKNVATITNGLDVVTALRPVEFDYILTEQHTAGFIAQEYEQVLPDQITEEVNAGEDLKALTNGEPVKGIQQNLVPYLVAAIKELKAEFDAYKAAHP